MPDRSLAYISFHHIDIIFPLPGKRALKGWLDQCIAAEDFHPGPLAFIFCSDEEILKINQTYLSHDTYTDVITFDYSEGKSISGDIYISIDRIKDNARTLKIRSLYELHRVMIHGVLHLCGYQDKHVNHKRQMTQKEDYYLSLRPAQKS